MSLGEMLGWQLICKLPLLVASPSSQCNGYIKITKISLHIHIFVWFVLKICTTFSVPLVLDQQGHSMYNLELHLYVHQGLLLTRCSNCYMSYLKWVIPLKWMPASHRGNEKLSISESSTLNILRGIYRITKIFHLLALL